MANVSVRLMVALFCAVVVATPAVLLSFLSQASDAAADGVIPPFFGAELAEVTEEIAVRMRRIADDARAARQALDRAACASHKAVGDRGVSIDDFCRNTTSNMTNQRLTDTPVETWFVPVLRLAHSGAASDFWVSDTDRDDLFATGTATKTRRLSRTATVSRSLRGRRVAANESAVAGVWSTRVGVMCVASAAAVAGILDWPVVMRRQGSKRLKRPAAVNLPTVLGSVTSLNRALGAVPVAPAEDECSSHFLASRVPESMTWFPLVDLTSTSTPRPSNSGAVAAMFAVSVTPPMNVILTGTAATRTIPISNHTRSRSAPRLTAAPHGRRTRTPTASASRTLSPSSPRNFTAVELRSRSSGIIATAIDPVGIQTFINGPAAPRRNSYSLDVERTVAQSLLPSGRAATALLWTEALRIRPRGLLRCGTLDTVVAASRCNADAVAVSLAVSSRAWPAASAAYPSFVVLDNATSAADEANRAVLEQQGIAKGMPNPRIETVLQSSAATKGFWSAPDVARVVHRISTEFNVSLSRVMGDGGNPRELIPVVTHLVAEKVGRAIAERTGACRYAVVGQSLTCAADVYLLEPRCEVAPMRFTEPSALDCYITLRRVTIVVATEDPENSVGTSLFSGTRAVSVIVGVTTAAGAIVCILALLHFVFHPLKVIGNILRALADINLTELDRMEASFIRELYDMQMAVDKLRRRMHRYGRYMPDKSQLNAVLDTEIDLKCFEDTKVALAPLKASKAVGAIPHSVTIHAEYRSRHRPQLSRNTADMKKVATFALVFSSGDDVHEMLLSQIRVRFGERVGEPLEIRDKGAQRRSRLATHEALLLHNADDIMQAIERCRDNVLQLIVVKASTKRYYPWFLLISSMAATIVVGRLCTTWLAADALYVQRAGGFAAFAVTTKLGGNILCCGYLLRRFVLGSGDFAQWVPVAMQETVFAILSGAFTVSSLLIMSSHTRLTRFLRFNAPRVANHERLILKYAIIGYVVGEAAPLMAISYVAASAPDLYFDPLAASACGLLALSISAFVMQKALPAFVAYLQRNAAETDDSADGGAVGRVASQMLAGTMLTVMHRSGIADEYSYEGSHGRALRDGNYVGGLSTDAAPGAHQQQQQQGSISTARLALCDREATVLRLGIRQSDAHFVNMSTVEIQLFCERFLGYVFAEIRSFGGMIMAVRGTEVTACFNCHRVLLRHVISAFRAFVAVHQSAAANLVRWSTDDDTRPQVFGAIVSGRDLTIGYTGRSESRAIQHLGYSSVLLDALYSIAEHNGAALVIPQDLAGLAEDWVDEEERSRAAVMAAASQSIGRTSSFATTVAVASSATNSATRRRSSSTSSTTVADRTEFGDASFTSMSSIMPTGLREIDVFRVSVGGMMLLKRSAHQQQQQESAASAEHWESVSMRDGRGAESQDGSVAGSRSRGGGHNATWSRIEPVYEVCFDMPQDQMLSARSCFSALQTGPNAHAVQQHLAKYQNDVPLYSVAVWSGSSKAQRLVSGFGPQLHDAEVLAMGRADRNNAKFGFAGFGEDVGQGDVGDDGPSPAPPRELGGVDRNHPVVSKVLGADKYTVYFTDI